MKNKKYQGVVSDYTYDGLGIIKLEGYIIFVEHALLGEEVEFRVSEIKKNFSFGVLTKVLIESEHRVEPLCKYYYQCGGCNIMHMDYLEQVNFKKKYVRDLLKRSLLINVKDIELLEAENPFHYRNKTIIPFDYKIGTCQYGLYKRKSHDIINNDDCLIANEIAYKLAATIKDYIELNKYYDNINNIIVRTNHKDEAMLIIVSAKIIDIELVDLIKEEYSNVISIVNNINSTDNNKILGKQNYVLFGEDFYYDKILDNNYLISSKSFFQVNPVQAEKLYSRAIEYASLNKDMKVIDAYSGIGSIALSIAKSVDKVLGIEVLDDACKMARKNAEINNITNAEFVSAKAEDVIKNYTKEYNMLIVDPPRKGLDNKFKEAIIESGYESIVYVSCNPSTLVRDIKDIGYKLEKITLVDMFPNTNHLECVVLLSRIKE